jgi:hypothetical protein
MVSAPGAKTKRLLDGLFGLTPVRLALWVYLIRIILPGIFSDAFMIVEYFDEHHFYNWEDADRIAIVDHHELPLWNPYYCGGMVSAASPESGVFAPDFLLRMIFGVTHGRRFALLLFVVLGMEGMYRLVRTIDGSAFAGIFSAVLFSTWNPLLHSFLTRGWVNFFGFELVPWVLLGFIKGRESVPWRIVGGMALAWIVLAAGTYSAPYTALMMAYLTFALAIVALTRDRETFKRELKGTILSGLTIGIVAAGLSMAKLLPMMVLMRQFPRVFTPTQTNELFALLQGYWHLYAIVILVAFVALVFADWWARIFFAGSIIFLVAAMGHFADWAPSTILRKLPLVSGLREPDRFLILFHVCFLLAAAKGIAHVEDIIVRALVAIWSRFRKPEKRTKLEDLLIPLAFTALAASIVVHYLRPELEGMAEMNAVKEHTIFTFESPRAVVQPFKQSRGNRRDAQIYPIAGRGTLYCLVAIPIPESPDLRADLEEEEYPENPALAKVERVGWTPHSVTLKVEAKAPSTIIVNQNYHANWRSDVGVVKSKNGLLAVEVPAGTHTVVLRYRDWLSIFAILLSLATLFGSFYVLGRYAKPIVRERWEQYRAWGIPLSLVVAKPKEEEKKKEEKEEKEKEEKEEEEKKEEEKEEDK